MSTFFLNGNEITVQKNQKLLRFLRDELHITSAKDGCSEGACGACTVLIEGEPCRACIPDTDRLDGKHVLTVEGLSDFEKAVFTFAFGEAGAVQCGFCIPGMVLCAKSLLDKCADPTEEQIRFAIRNNYWSSRKKAVPLHRDFIGDGIANESFNPGQRLYVR